jgi:hypothetical protein
MEAATPAHVPELAATEYPVGFSVEYPDRPLNRLTSALRMFTIIPIAILLASIVGWSGTFGSPEGATTTIVIAGVGILFLPVVLMLLFRRKYPRWWFDWNLNLQRFANRVTVYAFLMDDRYPSTDDEQSVRLDYVYPEAERDLNRWLPLVKWLLVIPHLVVLAFLYVGVFAVVVYAWFAILFTGLYPRGAFGFVEGVLRWHNRVVGYSYTLVTDEYPPFSLRA